MSALDEALKAVKRGWFIFPIKPNSKKPPLIKDWENQSSDNPKQIKRWAKETPGCNWGVACGRSGLAVVDVDVKNGKPGKQTLRDLETKHGPLPECPTVATPSGGIHFYFSGECASGTDILGPGIDIKSIGGYVLLPGSKTDEGEYSWMSF